MKIDLYADIYPGLAPGNLFASQSPGYKGSDARRYRITVNIPDHAFTGVIDGVAPVGEIKEVDV